MTPEMFERNMLTVAEQKRQGKDPANAHLTPDQVPGPLGNVMRKHNLTFAQAVAEWEKFGG